MEKRDDYKKDCKDLLKKTQQADKNAPSIMRQLFALVILVLDLDWQS